MHLTHFPFFLPPQVIDKSMPVFSKQFYSDTVAENIELHSPLSVAIQAESPLGRKLIYSIVKGNELEEFAVDFNTGESSLTRETPQGAPVTLFRNGKGFPFFFLISQVVRFEIPA